MEQIGHQAAIEWSSAGPGHRFVRRLGAALLIVSLLPGATLTSSLEVKLVNLRSDKGMVRLCLTADPANFPDCKKDADAIKLSVPADRTDLNIDGLEVGSYALSVIHDENDNAKLDTFAGIPREGFGFSRNPRIMFGPPRFSSARFALNAGQQVETVKMRYFL